MGTSRQSSSTLKTNTIKASEKLPDVTLKDFIPFAAFYNEQTILTKNGELMQTLKIINNIHGLPTEDAQNSGVYLREAIRQALGQHITTPNFSVWMHTLRKKTPLAALSKPSQVFAAELQQEWLSKQRVGFSYHNECYITILSDGEEVKLFNPNDFKKSNRASKNRKSREAFLDQAFVSLEATVQRIKESLSKNFQVNQLGMVLRPVSSNDATSAYYSQQLEFLHRIVQLEDAAMPVKTTDLSAELATHDMIFGFDALEVKRGKSKHFASVVSLKHYHELPPEMLDRFLQVPVEMVVTQMFDYIPAKKACEETNDIREVLRRSKDGYIANASGFINMLEANSGKATDYTEQQTTMMLMADSYNELNEITTEIQTAIAKMGLVSVREDIKLEECFWSQLPANFEFVRRKHAVAAPRVCGLARLNYYPTGKMSSKWGEAITILPTVTHTPYLFHFHEGQHGHSLLIDYNSFPDTMGYRLTHFLSAAASKQVKRVVMFDRHGSAEMFVNAMGGSYLRLGGKQRSLALNPFAMSPIPRNQGFLAAWVAALLYIDVDDAVPRAHIKAALSNPWDAAEASQGFAALVNRLKQHDVLLGEQLQAYMKLPAFGNAVASGMDNIALDTPFTAINLHRDAFSEGSHFAAFSLLLHRVILSLDGAPTLIVIKDAWDVLEHPFFASRLESLFEMLSEQNAMILATMRDVDKIEQSSITKDLLRLTPTKIFMPDDIASDYLADVVGLSASEDAALLRMERQKGDILIKHGAETIPTRFRIDNPKLLAVLTGDAKALHGMRQG